MSINFQPFSEYLCSEENIYKNEILNNITCSNYYAEYFHNNFIDLSSIILFDQTPIGYISCCILNKKITWPGGGVIVKLFRNEIKLSKDLYHEIILYLHELAKTTGSSEILVKDHLEISSALSKFSESLLNKKFFPSVELDMIIPFTEFSRSLYFSKIRKSYKSLINWGKKNLNVVYINKENLNKQLFDEFKIFHRLISQKATRSDISWEIQYNIIENGYGELILGFYQDQLVAGSLFIDQSYKSIYFTGVYERKLFKYGISHFLLYDGICRSHLRGNSELFYIGNFDFNTIDKKLEDIQFFKKGFCENITTNILWKKNLDKDE